MVGRNGERGDRIGEKTADGRKYETPRVDNALGVSSEERGQAAKVIVDHGLHRRPLDGQ